MSLELLIATTNPGKIREITSALAGLDLQLHTLSEFSAIEAPEENGMSYHENAMIKAEYYAAVTGLLTLADDSGLEVQTLGGLPGINTARFGGPGLSDVDRYNLLLRYMHNEADRSAIFVCVIALVSEDKVEIAEGRCQGTVAQSPAGENGFGFDPIFIPDGFDETFAQLSDSIKNRISHRGRALASTRQILEKWSNLTRS
jgi:XTP/dITP diphosphohydrolase